MKWTIVTLTVLIGLCICSACIQNQEISTPNVTDEPVTTLPIPSTAIPTPTATPNPIRAITIIPTPTEEPTEEEWVPDWTPEPTILPKANPDVNGQNFTKFSNRDFFCHYPSTWTVENETIDVSDITVFGKDVWMDIGRKVSFISEDRNVSMIVTVYDFITPGQDVKLGETIDKSRNAVQKRYPNANADTSVYGYQYFKNEQGIVISRYDVIFSQSSEYYPYSYTEEMWTTVNHKFVVNFIAKNGDLYDYNSLKYMMLKSVTTEGLQGRSWWMN